MRPPGAARLPSSSRLRAALSVKPASGSSATAAAAPSVSRPLAATLALPLDCNVRLTGARWPSAATSVRRPAPGWRLLCWPVRPASACQPTRVGRSSVPGAMSSRATPSTLKLAKPPCEKNPGTRPSWPGAASDAALSAMRTLAARKSRLPPRAPASAMPRSVPASKKGLASTALPSASGVLLSTRLPALPPATAPLAATRTPPDTSSNAPAPTARPAPERSASVPPVVAKPRLAALALAVAGAPGAAPSRSALTKPPARSSVTPGATVMSPAGAPGVPPAPACRPLVSTVRLPPALCKSPPSTMPALPRDANVTLLRSASASAAPASSRRLPSVASVMLPKPAPASVAAAMRDSAGRPASSGALIEASGAAQNDPGSAAGLALSRRAVSTPVPANVALPKLPLLLTLPSRNSDAPASASRPSRWRSPTTVAAASWPSSSACAALTSNCPPARPSV